MRIVTDAQTCRSIANRIHKELRGLESDATVTVEIIENNDRLIKIWLNEIYLGIIGFKWGE